MISPSGRFAECERHAGPRFNLVYCSTMEKISKTQKKKDALSQQELGEKLVKLTDEQLKGIDLPEDIYDAVMLAKKIKKHGGLKRQIQYIGVLMRKTDTMPIQDALQNMEDGNRRQVELLKQVETWRDELIRGNDALLEELARGQDETDRRQLTDLVARARQEATRKNPSPAASRLLFRHLYKFAHGA